MQVANIIIDAVVSCTLLNYFKVFDVTFRNGSLLLF